MCNKVVTKYVSLADLVQVNQYIAVVSINRVINALMIK